MDLSSKDPSRTVFQQLQARQRADGNLLTALVVAAVFVTLRFAWCPGPDSAFVMALFFVAVVVASVRLLASAARIVQIRQSRQPGDDPQPVIDVEILDVYEHPAGLGAPAFQTTSAWWLPEPRRQVFSSQSTQIVPAAYLQARNRGLK
jgi:hypothetical protein